MIKLKEICKCNEPVVLKGECLVCGRPNHNYKPKKKENKSDGNT